MTVASNNSVAAASLLTAVFLHGFAFTLYSTYLSNSVGRKKRGPLLLDVDDETSFMVSRNILYKVILYTV